MHKALPQCLQLSELCANTIFSPSADVTVSLILGLRGQPPVECLTPEAVPSVMSY